MAKRQKQFVTKRKYWIYGASGREAELEHVASCKLDGEKIFMFKLVPPKKRPIRRRQASGDAR